MSRRAHLVRVHAAFDADFARQLRWLERHGEIPWVENLRREALEVRELLGQFPSIGRILAREEPVDICSILFPKAPYVVWYLNDPKSGDVWLLRLFHVRQDRSTPNLRRWRKRI